LGIVSLLFMIFLPPVGVVVGILGLIFGIIGVRRARRGEATNRSQALAGAITGGIGLVVSIVIVTILGVFVFTHQNQFNQYTRCLQNAHTQHARDVCSQEFRNSINR
jgi:heme/copper-type cytochrome/quinol oxidase subunit 2